MATLNKTIVKQKQSGRHAVSVVYPLLVIQNWSWGQH